MNASGRVQTCVVAVFALLMANTASAADFLTYLTQVDDALPTPALAAAAGMAVSADGAHLYAVSAHEDAVTHFLRNTTTGALTFDSVIAEGDSGASGLFGASAVVVSPDQSHLYVAGSLGDSIAVFSRHPVSGQLTWLSSVQDGVAGVDGLNQVLALAISADGQHLYAAGERDQAIAIFSRNTGTGALSYVGSVRDGVGGVDGLGGVTALALSPDGDQLYACGANEDAVAAFARNGTSGLLSFVAVYRDGVDGFDGLEGARSIVASGDGLHIYVAGEDEAAIAVLDRNLTDGALSFREVERSGTAGVSGLGGVRSVVLSPDANNLRLYAVSFEDDAVVAFSRDAQTGGLSFIEAKTDDSPGVSGIYGVQSVAVSPDGRRLYTASEFDQAVAIFGTVGSMGDGTIDPGEACDDGNTADGDGCSSGGIPEDGWQCSGGPSVCTPICGDGRMVGTEQCDDSNSANGDCCSSSCVFEAEGSPCAPDAVSCTADSCDGGGACEHVATNSLCNDGNPCTDDICNPTTDCQASANSAACDDGSFCNGPDTCAAGSCGIHLGDPCPGADGDSNCAESCDEGSDTCTASDANGSPCADGSFCTLIDSCVDGACVGSGNPCPGPDGDGNCAESCDEATDTCSADDPNGSACSDGLFCTTTDTCNSGTCSGSGNPCPGADGDENCAESCNEAEDNCTAADPNGSSCSDSLFCNGSDTCSSGSCSQHGGDPCTGGGACNATCNESVDNCFAAAGSACPDDGTTCTSDECNGSGVCNHEVVVERHDCGNCEDGIDNDESGDDHIDAEDGKCATLADFQRFGVLATAVTGSRHVDSGGGVGVLSTGGANPDAPYPSGPSRGGVCGNSMKVLTGADFGFLAVAANIAFGQSSDDSTEISVREEYVSDGGEETYKSSPPLVGPGRCSNNVLDLCLSAEDCGGAPATCDGRRQLNDMANPYVDRGGAAENFNLCTDAIAAALGISQAIATIPANVAGYAAADKARILTNKATPAVTIPVGGGLQVLEVDKVQLQGLSKLTLEGTPTTILLIRVKGGLKLGASAEVILEGGLATDHVLWSVEDRGAVTMKQSAVFRGTVFGPVRKIKLGAGVTVEGGLLGAKVKLLGNASVEHVPFTQWVD